MFYSKKINVILMACIFLLVFNLTACSSDKKVETNSSADEKDTLGKPSEVITLKLGHEQPEDHPYHYGAVKFSELVDEKTNGGIKVEVFTNATLGSAAAMTESISMGTLDFAEVFSIVLEKYDPRIGVFTLPYCFTSWDHAWKVLDSDFGRELYSGLEPKGIKVLSVFTNGLANVNTTKPIKMPSDIKGIKLRVQEGPTYVELGNVLGTVTTPMAYGEVYSALQLGTIDGQLQTINNIRSKKFNEVAKYYTNINMCFNTQPFIMSKAVYDRLPIEYQKAIEEAALEAAVSEREFHEKQTLNDIEEMRNAGMQIYDLTNEELAVWHKAVEPVYDKFPNLKADFEKIQSMK